MKNVRYIVCTLTESGVEYMVKGGFGNNEEAAQQWATAHDVDMEYPNGLLVKKLEQ